MRCRPAVSLTWVKRRRRRTCPVPAQALGVKVANLAQLTAVHRNTLRNPSSERLQGRMREMVKVISAATELAGDVDKAIYWYRNEPIADYGHRTAAELVADG